MPYCVLPLSVLQYIAVLEYVVGLIKEHIISLKLVSRNEKLYCIFNNWILTTWKATNIAIYQYIAMCNISIFFVRRIVLYCSNEYCNISIYCNIVASLMCDIYDMDIIVI